MVDNENNLDENLLYDAWLKSRTNSNKKHILGDENMFQQFMIKELVVYKIKNYQASSSHQSSNSSSSSAGSIQN